MKTLSIESHPMTAAQYLARCEAARNTRACQGLDLREACFRGLCYAIATLAICIAGGNLIQALVLLSR